MKNRARLISPTTLSASIVGGAFLLAGTSALAQPPVLSEMRPYVGASYGGFKARGGEFDDENDLVEVNAGLQFNPYLGVEVSYTYFGEYGGNGTTAEVDGYGLAGVASWPISRTTSLYLKAGQFFGDVDVDVNDLHASTSDNSLFFGVGANFTVYDPVVITVEYDRYDIDTGNPDWPVGIGTSDTDLDALKVGLKYMF